MLLLPIDVNLPKTPAPHGLLGSVGARNPSDERWMNGVTFLAPGCNTDIMAICEPCEIPSPFESIYGTYLVDPCDNDQPVVFHPISLAFGLAITGGAPLREEYMRDVKQTFDAYASIALEMILWDGCPAYGEDWPENPYLASSYGSNAATPAEAFATVMDYGEVQGTIHTRPSNLVTIMDSIYVDGEGHLRTIVNNHLVIAGNGYGAKEAGNAFFYHPGEPVVYLGDVETAAAEDAIRTQNDPYTMLTRQALVAFNPCGVDGEEWVAPAVE